MPSRTFLYGTGGLPLVPGFFSSPRRGAISTHKSSGIRLMVGSSVAVFMEGKSDARRYQVPTRRRLAIKPIFGIGSKSNRLERF
jgi:hypothetical protein